MKILTYKSYYLLKGAGKTFSKIFHIALLCFVLIVGQQKQPEEQNENINL